ncbi:MlaD family protein [Nocardioides sp. BP30]|uniref:MlaD family protein n=1 Tax=Nocardioides sp. BP30 TaxID=3036374 RepID=UPI002468527A|nr:MlaD family protein [Nocardioides sp. BP30]WGL53042.1 MlaD family protein [Nocardioides sp. BP30]
MRATLIKSIVFTVVTVLATVTLASVIRNGSSGPHRTYSALFSDVTSLNKGDDVRMAGVKIGTVTRVALHDNDIAKVTFTVADSAPLDEGSTAELRFRNLVGQRYIDLHPADSAAPALPAGYTFTLAQTKPALDLTLLFNGFQPLFQFLDPKDVNTLSGEIIAVFQGEGPTVSDLLSSTASLTSTLADRDQVIGDLITNLNDVMGVVDAHSDQLDTTLVTLEQLVSGLAADRTTIGDTIGGLGELTTSVADLLGKSRAPLKKDIASLGELSDNLSSGDQLDSMLKTLPTKLDAIGRTASYGSWLNFYVCSIQGEIPLPDGYFGDLGANPVAPRCS